MKFRYNIKTGGYSKKMFHCPCCNQNLHRKTLFLNITPSQWALYLYAGIKAFKDEFDESKSFYNKINFKLLMLHLKELGIATEFWDSWKSSKEKISKMDKNDVFNLVKNIEDEFYDKNRYKQVKLGGFIETSK